VKQRYHQNHANRFYIVNILINESKPIYYYTIYIVYNNRFKNLKCVLNSYSLGLIYNLFGLFLAPFGLIVLLDLRKLIITIVPKTSNSEVYTAVFFCMDVLYAYVAYRRTVAMVE
jgi:hypothetical protein